MTGGEDTEMDNNQCKLEEESKAVDTAAAANSEGSATCEEDSSNPVITSSVHVDEDESDELDTVHASVHNDEGDETTKSSTGEQQRDNENVELERGSSPSESAEDNNTIGDNTDEPVQL